MDLMPGFVAGDLGAASAPSMALSALVLGASGSLHCFLMCGPLACAASAPVQIGTGPKRANSAAAAYHAARITAYTLVGGGLGLFGGAFSRAFTIPLRGVLPWLLVAALLASVMDLGKRLAPLPVFAKVVRAAGRAGAALTPRARALVLGAITPLLPCGLLYGLFAAAFAAASLGGGALLLGAFAVGGTPALLLAQVPGGLARRLGGWRALVLQKGVPLVAAAVIAYRAVQAARGQDCH
jgi:hypothetical protein